MRGLQRCGLASVGMVLLALATGAPAQPAPRITVQVQARPVATELVCAPRVPAPAAPQGPSNEAPAGPPTADEVDAQLTQAGAVLAWPSPAQPLPLDWRHAPPGQALRVAFWGDSHLAAGFFTDELARLSGLAPGQVVSRFIGANINRAGVRLPLRKSCVDGRWQYEPAHARAVASTGPGLVSLSSSTAGSALAWDLRGADGQPRHATVHLLYEQPQTSVSLWLQVDEGDAVPVQLPAGQGPGVLSLEGSAPLSLVRVQLLAGSWRWQGLTWLLPGQARLQLDVFGYPGATVAGWAQADAQGLPDWWEAQPYDLVALEFGTNEGNVQPFDATRYEAVLRQAVARWRERFAQARCVLIGPGDRGVLVRQGRQGARASPSSAKASGKKSAVKKTASAGARPQEDLLRFTRTHLQINRLQQQVAAEHGCHFWSMLSPMGGAGGAYRWAARKPAWMARDLIHFTVPGYQQLAQEFARELGWGPAWFAEGGDAATPAPR